MEILKAAVRLIVFAFVFIGAMITMAGTDQDIRQPKSISAEKNDTDNSFTTSKQDLVVTGHLDPSG